MQLFVVQHWYGNDTGTVVGVFSTIENARKFARSKNDGTLTTDEGYSIVQHTLDFGA